MVFRTLGAVWAAPVNNNEEKEKKKIRKKRGGGRKEPTKASMPLCSKDWIVLLVNSNLFEYNKKLI